jgi:hypothetical protein
MSNQLAAKPLVEHNGKKINHSTACQWTGKKGTRYTQTKGICEACDVIRGHKRYDNGDNLPLNTFGLKKEDRDKIYCITANVAAARCTKYTNPSCACGRLVYGGSGEM